MPTVSVVVPCFNAAAWIRETLQSVVAQDWERLEIIAIDDGSTDGTGGIIEREWPRAKVLRTENRGASRARNVGTSLAAGEFIQYLDADDLLAGGKIHAQVVALMETDADVAYGDFQRLEPSDGGFRPAAIVTRRLGDSPDLDLFGEFWCPPAAYLFRRRIVEKVGSWNENLPVIQDARFVLDCALRGARFVRTPGVLAYYRAHTRGSLSRRNPAAFCRDVYRNALEVEAWWRQHGGMTTARLAALVGCFGWVATESVEVDRGLFESALADLDRLAPGYVPESPRRLKLMARWLGYRRAVQAHAFYGRAKRVLGPTP